jgi:hypothetical protein
MKINRPVYGTYPGPAFQQNGPVHFPRESSVARSDNSLSYGHERGCPAMVSVETTRQQATWEFPQVQ